MRPGIKRSAEIYLDEILNTLRDRGTTPCNELKEEHRRAIVCMEEKCEPKYDFSKLGDILGIAISPLGYYLRDMFRSKLDAYSKVVVPVVLSDAATSFTFTPSHPVAREVYLSHPLNTCFYVPATNYGATVYEEISSDFMNLLTILAVKRIKCRWQKGERMFLGFQAGASGANLDINGGLNGNIESETKFDGFGSLEPKHPCRLPMSGELLWYEHFPSWRSLANSVVNGGAKQLSFTFEYDLKCALGASILAQIQDFLMKTGINLKNDTRTCWYLELEF